MEDKKTEGLRKGISYLAVVSAAGYMIFWIVQLINFVSALIEVEEKAKKMFGNNINTSSVDRQIVYFFIMFSLFALYELAFLIPGILSLKNNRLTGGVLMIVFSALSLACMILVLSIGLESAAKEDAGLNVSMVIGVILMIALRVVMIAMIAYYKQANKYAGSAPYVKVEDWQSASAANTQSPVRFNTYRPTENPTEQYARKQVCMRCGKIAEPDAKFCKYCGHNQFIIQR